MVAKTLYVGARGASDEQEGRDMTAMRTAAPGHAAQTRHDDLAGCVAAPATGDPID